MVVLDGVFVARNSSVVVTLLFVKQAEVGPCGRMRGGVFDQLLVGGNGVVRAACVGVGQCQEQQHGIVVVLRAALAAQSLQPCCCSVEFVAVVAFNRGQQRTLLSFLIGCGEGRANLLCKGFFILTQRGAARFADQLDQCQSKTDHEDTELDRVRLVHSPAVARGFQDKQGNGSRCQYAKQHVCDDCRKFRGFFHVCSS